jgi:hypothetical protein
MTPTLPATFSAKAIGHSRAPIRHARGNKTVAEPSKKGLRVAVVTPMLPVPHDMTRGRFTYETARSLAKLADVRVFFQSMRYPRLPGMKPRSYIYGKVDANYSLPDLDVEAFDFPAVQWPGGQLGAQAAGSRIRS